MAWPALSCRTEINTQRGLRQSTSSSSVEEVLAAQPDLVSVEGSPGQFSNKPLQQWYALQDSFQLLVQAANLSQLLFSSNSSYTLFAPTDAAITAAIANKAIPCQTDFEDDQPCTSLSAVLNSTGLPQLVLDHGKPKLYKGLSLVNS